MSSTSADTKAASTPEQSGRLLRAASRLSVLVAVVLITVKAYVWFRTGSVAMLSSLVDSLMDAGASVLNLIAIRHALTPADAEHRFGHGKAEALAGLGQSAFIAGSAGFLVFEASKRLMQPVPIEHGMLGILVMVISIALTLGLVLFQRYVIRRTGSLAVSADSLHYAGDLLTNLAVIVAFVLATQFALPIADPLLALAIAAYILYSAWQILRDAYDHLMDRELPDDVRENIRRVVLTHPEVRSLHDLRTRASGAGVFIQLHLEMDGDISLVDAHRIADQVESSLRAVYPGAEIIVHQDPAGIDERRPEFAGR